MMVKSLLQPMGLSHLRSIFFFGGSLIHNNNLIEAHDVAASPANA